MKITAILLLIGCLHVNAKGFTQGISLSLKNVSLDKVFTELHNQTGYAFFYDLKEVRNAKPVTIEVKKKTLEEVLDQCLRDQPLTYAIVSKTVVIKPKPSTTAVLQPADNSASTEPPPIDVKGRVLNEDGEPVAGASVRVKGTGKGTTTNNNGEFSVQGVSEDAVLVFSGVNIETMEMKVGGKTNLSVSVKNKVTNLGEVIINKGYYTEKQKLSTGDVSVVTGKDIEKQPVGNVLGALEGSVPGLVINQSTGVPGGAYAVQIRGQNSLINGNDPFYVIDGVPYSSQTVGLLNSNLKGNYNVNGSNGSFGNPLNYLSPSDIESISVLKDADATSIYGSRAANGAILITTKRGKIGATKVDLNFYSGIGQISHKLNLSNTSQYLEMRHEAFKNDGAIPGSRDYDINGAWDTTRYTDWQKVLIGNTSHYTDAQASVSGGTEYAQFLVGTGYHKETTVYPGTTADQKVSAHANAKAISQNRKFKLTFSSSYIADLNTVPLVDLTTNTFLPPDAPSLYNSDRSLNWAPLVPGQAGTWNNPMSWLLYNYKARTNNIIANTVISYNLFKALDLKVSTGYTHTQTNETVTAPTYTNDPGYHTQSGYSQFNSTTIGSWIIEPQAIYKLVIGKGTISALTGFSFQENTLYGQSLYATGFSNDALLEDIQAASRIKVLSAINSDYKYSALFGRLGYNWDDRYLLNLSARRDGSSRFGPGNQFANFSSIAGGWVFSKENFFEENVRFLSYGKIRASYGTSGNDQVGDYRFLDLYVPTQNPYGGSIGLYPSNLFNENLAWELTKKLEGSIELGFLKDRITVQTTYYINRSSNQLVSTPLSIVTGFSSISTNLPATVQNSGIELLLNTINIKSSKFSWRTSFNLTIPKNKLVSFPNLAGSAYANLFVVGKPVTTKKVYQFRGVNDTTGVYQFFDAKGEITSYPNYLRDANLLTNKAPDFYGGFLNSVTYKNFELDVLFQFEKQKVQNVYGFLNAPPGFMLNQPNDVLVRWQKTGDIRLYQQFSQNPGGIVRSSYINNYRNSDAVYPDASFIRLRNLSIAYNFSSTLTRKMHIQNFRVYVRGQNVFTITHYLGWDPETQGNVLPPLRVWAAGIQLGL